MRDGLYKRGRYWWFRDPVLGRRVSSKCTDRKAALLKRAERERIAADPVYAATHSATVSDWVKKTMDVKARSRKEGTRGMYGVKLGHVVRIFGAETTLADVNANTVDKYIAQRREEGAADNTIHRELTCLTQLLKLARRSGCYGGDISAIKPVGFSPQYNPRKTWLPKAEAERLLASLPADRAAWVTAGLITGGRKSEIDAMRPEHYDPDAGVVTLHGTKTAGSHREVPILPAYREAFEAALLELEPWVRASHELPEACRRAKVTPVTPNDLRRTMATWLLQDGAEEALVSRLLGHGSMAMIRKVYGQLGGAKLGKLLADQTGTTTSQHDPKGPWPLGGTGRRRGFKRPSAAAHGARDELDREVGRGGDTPSRGVSGTSSAHSRAFRAQAWTWFARAA